MAGLWDALKQYIGDALPGGALNPETQPVATRANYLSGILDPASQVSQDAQAWHKRTQNGLMDQLAGRDTPEAEQAYQTMMQAAGMAPVGMIAWHGSPHKFDKFTLGEQKTTLGPFSNHGVSLSPDMKTGVRYKNDFGNGNGNLYKVDIPDDAKTLNLSAQEFHKLQDLTGKIDSGVPLSESESMSLDFLLSKNGLTHSKHPIDSVKAGGFHAIASDSGRHGLSEREILAFDPELIRILERNGQPTGLQPWKPGEWKR